MHLEVDPPPRASGTPFISFFTPPEMLTLAREAGLKEVRRIIQRSSWSRLRPVSFQPYLDNIKAKRENHPMSFATRRAKPDCSAPARRRHRSLHGSLKITGWAKRTRHDDIRGLQAEGMGHAAKAARKWKRELQTA
jgi:hypothetical protein